MANNDPAAVFLRVEKEYFNHPSEFQQEIVIVNAPDMTQKKNRNIIMAVVNDFEINR